MLAGQPDARRGPKASRQASAEDTAAEAKSRACPWTYPFGRSQPGPIAGLHCSCPVSASGTGADRFESVTVIGTGRAGSAIAARLRERGVSVRDEGDLRLLCVPDRAIAEAAAAIEPGPWI